MGRDIGKLGESYLEVLCHQIGITPNPVKYDETGWDNFLEFPLEFDHSKPLDISGPTLKCFIQVKSTESGKKGSQVKISNLKRFLDTNDPCFFIFMVFTDDDFPSRVFLTHMDETLIEKTLKKLRKLGASNNIKLHKKSILVSYKGTDELLAINGKTLKSKILQFVPNGMEEYRIWKMRLIKSIGYENHGHRADFLISAKDLDDLIDTSLNETFELKSKEFRVWDERFGIPIERKDLSRNIKKVVIQRNQIEKYRVSFSSKKRTVWIEAEIIVSLFDKSGNPSKMRVFNEFLDFRLAFDSGRTTINTLTNSNKRIGASAYENFGQFLLILEEGGHVKFKIHFESSFELDMDFSTTSIETELIKFRTACLTLPKLTKQLQLSPDLNFSPNEVYSNRNKIINAYNYLISGEYVLRIETGLDKKIIDISKVGLAIFFHFTIGSYSIGCKLRIKGHVIQLEDKKVGFQSKAVKIIDPGVFEKTDDLVLELTRELEEIESEMAESGFEIIKTAEPFFGLINT